MESIELTSAKAARLLDVHESSVKRWSNQGDLPTTTTSGGHRRIKFDDLMAFAGQRDIEFPLAVFEADGKHVWAGLQTAENNGDWANLQQVAMRWIEERQLPNIVELLRYLGGQPDIPLTDVFDKLLRPVLQRVGVMWARGDISVSHEHVVSKTVQHGLYALNEARRAFPAPRANATAIVGCAQGNDHEIAAFCIRTILESLGWTVYYLGANVPTVEFVTMGKRSGARLTCISYSPAATTTDAIRDLRLILDLEPARDDVRIAVGGASLDAPSDAMPEGLGGVKMFTAIRPFAEWLESL